MPRNSEFRVYGYITQSLKDLGWDIRNPARYAAGQVYTQNEASQNPELKKCLFGQKPENVVVIDSDIFWAIEAKAEHTEIAKAIKEAQEYAELINKSSRVKCLFATGIAGNKNETYLVETFFTKNGKWERVKINDFETTGFIDQEQAKQIIQTANPNLKDQEIPEKLFDQKANEINKILHKGAINKKNRARVIASLLLALANDTNFKISQDPTTLTDDINTRVKGLLRKYKKENFAQEIKINAPLSTDNHRKNHRALVDCIQILKNLNIKSAINSGSDLLGSFYEIFLKYANDAKEIGIVLTPRHITRFAAKVLNITEKDFVFDPTCGTGGFLVAALDSIKKSAPTYMDDFKNSHIYGIEQDPEIVALALVNMIFRGDGNGNIYEGNCLDNRFIKSNNSFKKTSSKSNGVDTDKNFITKVLMNPPFAVDEEEYIFVDHALSQMLPNGLLFAVVPTSMMTSTSDGRGEITWRKEMLKRHTLKAVVKLSDELFAPIANKGTYGIILEAWRPHEDQRVFFAIMDDGFTMKKAKRLPSKNLPSNIDLITEALRDFLAFGKEPKKVTRVVELCELHADKFIDCGAEAYIDDTIGSNINVSSTTANLFHSLMLQKQRVVKSGIKEIEYKTVSISDVFESVIRGDTPPSQVLTLATSPLLQHRKAIMA